MSQIFTRLEQLYKETLAIKDGDIATYIPQLAEVDPEQYAVGACLVDGQEAAWGDQHAHFCLQSVCKPFNYCLALEEHGEDTVHQHVGFEPSGQVFNALTLNDKGLPHNPLINAGGIMCCHLIQAEKKRAERFKHLQGYFEKLAGGQRLFFDNAVYQSELETAHRNFALAHFMQEQGAFLPNTSIEKTLSLYFQSCSMTLDISALAVMAATLANGGVNPKTGETLLQARTLRNCLTIMATCGMYNYSGEFAFRIGLPAKVGCQVP